MRYRTLFALIVVVTIAAFLMLNWRLFSESRHVNLVLASAEVPVGVVMLGLFAVIILALTVYVGLWQSTFLAEYRRQAKELQSQRTLADSAEASRFTELAALLRTEVGALDQRIQVALDALRKDFHETENSIAATLGELDDRLHRGTEAAVPGRGLLK